MSLYVISDIHGCYDDFMNMLSLINYDEYDDHLILAGDYIDRGKHSHEVINWMFNHNDNNIFLRGNHEEEFIAYIDLLNQIDPNDLDDLYDVCNQIHDKNIYFDAYGTIRQLIKEYSCTLSDLNKWAEYFKKMKLFFTTKVSGQKYAISHAGFIPYNKMNKTDRKEFLLYSREENLTKTEYRSGIVISGHTPTVLKDEFSYNKGNIYKHYNKDNNTWYYNIDCGCFLKNKYKDAKLACICLDDKKEYYI